MTEPQRKDNSEILVGIINTFLLEIDRQGYRYQKAPMNWKT